MIPEGEGPAGGIQIDAGIRGGQQHFIGAVVFLRDFAVADGSVISLQGGLIGVELIRPLQQFSGVLAVLRDDQFILAVVQEGRVGFHIAVSVRAGDGFRHHIVLRVAQQLGIRRPGKDDSGPGTGFGILNLGADHIGGLGEILGIQRAALEEVAGPFDRFLIVFGHGDEVGLAFRVEAHHVAGTAGLHSKGQQQVVQVSRERRGSDVAVAAFAGFGESNQGIRQLGVGGGHGQIQLIQPGFVNVHLVGRDGAHGELFGQRPDFSVRVGAQGFHGRILFKDRGEVGHVLRNQIREFDKIL